MQQLTSADPQVSSFLISCTFILCIFFSFLCSFTCRSFLLLNGSEFRFSCSQYFPSCYTPKYSQPEEGPTTYLMCNVKCNTFIGLTEFNYIHGNTYAFCMDYKPQSRFNGKLYCQLSNTQMSKSKVQSKIKKTKKTKQKLDIRPQVAGYLDQRRNLDRISKSSTSHC